MARKPKVLLTEPVFREVHELLKQYFELHVGRRGQFNDALSLRDAIYCYDGLLCMLSNPVNETVLSNATVLKVVANYAVGYNNIDIGACQRHNIRVANTPDVLTETTADGTIALLLSVVRRIPESERFLRNGLFDGWNPTGFLGLELSGATAGIIGMGRIGQAVAKRLRAFDMNIIYSNPKRLDRETETLLGARWFEDPLQIASRADVVSLHCPLTDKTRHLVNQQFLDSMKPDAYLINASRGPVVEEIALAMALHDRRIAGAGIDVFEFEPEVQDMLLSAPNAVLVPHITSATKPTRLKMGMLAAGAIAKTLCGADYPCHFVV
ncbi:MAG: D-glycerate dehydrogenase [Candidatus Cyclonatronum sp.]|uniref:2-hydroxyacid dehydrogenase n=1 Tax=Cyclonatronum sp. TaxID=3024185 RepID=UPI0025BC6984|nr:D-glycerate dehydrogenase [Cyclonatronum sp.]MCC5934958.1 D-glycerate dehydrogenase [Balneolales bacterium]MCH8487313.1 D-glycerate dehydrogenase [Cyclonatronum sp.]